VSLADKTHNLEVTRADVAGEGEETWSRFSQGRLASLGYYAALLAVYRKRVVPERMPKAVRLVERLEAALTALCRDDEEMRAALAAFNGEQ
jgi:hypothetical protein